MHSMTSTFDPTRFRSRRGHYATVFSLSLALLVIGISSTIWSAPMTFDEPAYVEAARDFIARTPSVNPEHPPLAKYVIALSIEVLGDNGFGWRLPSALAGALLALSAFGLTLRLTRDVQTAYVAWLLLIANGFWFVMGRLAMLPIYEVALETAGVWAFLIAVEEQKFAWFLWSGALFGLSIGCRWCGAVGLLVCLAYALLADGARFIRQLKNAIAIASTAIVVYAITWIPLIWREHRSARYWFAANAYIYEFHRSAAANARIGEAWWTWFVRFQPQPSLTYVIANPVIGVLGMVAVVTLLGRRKRLLPALYLAHVMLWASGVKHITFYYYYFEAFTWLTVALAVALEGVEIHRVRLNVVATACAVAAFVYDLPVLHGW
jgi:dolichyl-phosphate-mannose-protein mannosyltransferase